MRQTGLLKLCVVAAWFVSPAMAQSRSPEPASNGKVAACVKRGVAYFKEIGSYPTLKSKPNRGKSAEQVALERCRRTTTAF